MASIARKQAKQYLRSRGIPERVVDALMLSIVQEAMEQTEYFQSDRVYTAIGIMLHDVYGFGHRRILKGIKRIDELFGEMKDRPWPSLMQEFKDKTGIVIRNGDENRMYFEYAPKEEVTYE